MPYFRMTGALPAKRRTLFPDNTSGYYSEELIGEEGFSSDLSHVYHRHPPTAIVHAETVAPAGEAQATDNWPLLPRHFLTGKLGRNGDLALERVPLLVNDDVKISYTTSDRTSELYRDADGDQCLYIDKGSATLNSIFGELSVREGDYVVVPAGITHQWVPAQDGVSVLSIESRGHIKPPRRYLSDSGQFLEMAPYRERDLRGPERLLEGYEGEAAVVVKRGNRLTRLTYRNHPFDVVGWNGCVYPYALSIHDFEPIVGRIHQPPPVHQTFEGPGFVVCSFCPRPSDFDPNAVGGPANHANVDSDEVMFYAGGSYGARQGSGIDLGSLSLHPSGWTHGPTGRPRLRPEPGAMLDELAVMIDTFAPLQISSSARGIEDASYYSSWDRTAEVTK